MKIKVCITVYRVYLPTRTNESKTNITKTPKNTYKINSSVI